jgi:AcrR family transcriptional regulator
MVIRRDTPGSVHNEGVAAEEIRPEEIHVSDAPMRSDARRNLTRVLEAAGELFSEVGASVSMEAIAKRAGVGVGTVYRRFPTKSALGEAVLLDHLAHLYDEIVVIRESAPAEHALHEALTRIVEVAAERVDLKEAIGNVGIDIHVVAAPTFDKIGGVLRDLLLRSQEVGATRLDVDIDDVMGLLRGACTATTGRDGPSPIRLIHLISDGLRVSPTTALA